MFINLLYLVFVKEKNTLTEYSYEYLTALLMNLSLRKEGRKKFEEIIVLNC